MILTTDADSQVAPNWIAENLAAFEAGAEAVLGRIDLDEEGSYCPRRFIGAASLRTHTSDCSRNCPGCSILLNTIRGLTTPRSPARALASLAQPIAASDVFLASPWARTKR